MLLTDIEEPQFMKQEYLELRELDSYFWLVNDPGYY